MLPALRLGSLLAFLTHTPLMGGGVWKASSRVFRT